MIPFNYHHLYYFYVIAKEGSISRACEQLRLAQPTLSAQLKQFEKFLNVQLFLREKRKLVLTEEGHRVLSYAKMIFDIGQELKDRMVDLSHRGRPHIHIGITHYVPKTIIDLLLDFILRTDPNTYIHVAKDQMDKLIQDLDDHIVDVVLTDTPFETTLSGDISNKFIGKVPIVFCAHPRLAKKIGSFPGGMDGQPMIFPASPRQIAYHIKEFFYEHHIEPKIIGEIQDIETVRRLALRGYGIAALNLLTVHEAPSRQKLVILNTSAKHTIFE
ncbi:MAG: LysR family transcriptional regulator, partial [Candidatus Omnitrophica bacterium]|nr:LysR family transcriptional regulator [Candidatus Omnitrophota bacterium]